MSGIFATQFNTVNPYDPVGLDTGTPQVGMTLGKKKPRTPEEKTPSRVPPESGADTGTAASAGLAAGGYMHATASGSNQASVNANSSMSLSQAGAASHMSAANEAANGIGYHPDAAPATHVVMPKLSGADATPPKQTGGGGFLGWAEHTAGSIVHNPIVSDVMHFGDPFGHNDTGIAGAINPVQQGSSAINPTRVYNPSQSSAGEIGPSAPKVVPGEVVGEGALGNGYGARALPASSRFSDMAKATPKNMGGFNENLNSNQFSGVDKTSPWYDQIPNDISSIGEDALSAL